MDAISGLAYDNISPGGPFLWGFSQDSTGAIIIKYDIPNETQTGNMIDVSSLAAPSAAYAGGLFIEPMDNQAGVTMGGMIQNEMIFALELDYANALVGINDLVSSSEISIYPNPLSGLVNISINGDSKRLFQARILSMNGMIVKELGLISGQVSTVNLTGLPAGVYILDATDGNRTLKRKILIY
jgi:hypothetical protein